MDNLKKYSVEQFTNSTLTKVTANTFHIQREGVEETIVFDYAYICLGMQSDAPLLHDLCRTFQENGVEVVNIGNSARARRMIDGVREGRNILAVLERLEYFDGAPPLRTY